MASSTSVISATGEFLRHSSDTGGCLPIIIISLLCFHAARSCSSHRCCKSLPAGSSDYPSSLFSLPLPAEPSWFPLVGHLSPEVSQEKFTFPLFLAIFQLQSWFLRWLEVSKCVLLLLSPSPHEIFGKAMQRGLTPSSFLIIIIQEGLF